MEALEKQGHSVQHYLDETPHWPGHVPAETTMTAMQRTIFTLASAGKLFGGVIVFMTGMALPLISDDLSLNSTEQGLVSATALTGIMFGAVFLGRLSDTLGRKTMFTAEMVIFTGFLIVMTISPNLPLLLVSLFGMGLALGCDYPTAHLMLTETMPSSARAKTVLSAFGFQAAGALLGAVIAVAVLALGPESVSSWRIMFGLVIVPALAVTIGRFSVAGSPHWLLARGRTEDAEKALQKVLRRQPNYHADVKLAAPQEEKRESGRYVDLFRGQSRRATILASLPWFLQDLSTYGIGIFTPVIVATTLGEAAGVEDTADQTVSAVVHSSLLGAEGAVLIDLFLVIGVLAAIRYTDRFGSIKMQVWGFIGCAVGLAIAAMSQVVPHGGLETALVFAGFILFQFMTNAGPNSQTYLISGEVFPTALRGSGAGFAAACGKFGAVLAAFLFPILLASWGQTPTMIVLIGTSVLGAFITRRFRIDTTGKDLDSIYNEEDVNSPESA